MRGARFEGRDPRKEREDAVRKVAIARQQAEKLQRQMGKKRSNDMGL